LVVGDSFLVKDKKRSEKRNAEIQRDTEAEDNSQLVVRLGFKTKHQKLMTNDLRTFYE
jgi:hypothetical protein